MIDFKHGKKEKWALITIAIIICCKVAQTLYPQFDGQSVIDQIVDVMLGLGILHTATDISKK